MKLENCNCPVCVRNVGIVQMAATARKVTIVGEGQLRASYEEGRRLYRRHHPHITRDAIEGKEQ